MAEHQLDDASIDAVGHEAAGAFVTVVPMEVDLPQLLAVPGIALFMLIGI